jgi:lactate dehydrogenase-like 2-hydroxyacid dehydrogenase
MTTKPTVLVTRKLPAAVEARLRRDYDARLNPDDRLYSHDEIIERSRGVHAILPCHTEHFNAEVLARLPDDVRIIANFSVGYDHVDVAAARAKGIVVTNTPDVLSDATAELTMMLMIGAARRAGEGERLVRERRWKDWSPAFMVGTQVTGKRLGILGMGRVGRVVARRARGFDMRIHYHDLRPLADSDEGVYHATLDDMLPHCDFLSLHCNVTPETRGVMNARRFGLLPDGAILVNAARGALVNDDALIDALTSGTLRAAGIDAYNNEPNIDPRLTALPNTFLMPHIGSATRETRDAMGFRALDNLDAFFAGREPGDRVA